MISYNRKEWEAWRDNKVVHGYAFSRNSPVVCQWCGKSYEDALPAFDTQLWRTCFDCHNKVFYDRDYRTYDGVIAHRERHNKYWDRITGGKVPPIKVTEVHDDNG